MELKTLSCKGFSIIEVIVAMAIVMAAFLANIEFFRTTFTQQIKEEQGLLFSQSLVVFGSYLANETSCKRSLSDNPQLASYNGQSIKLNNIKRGDGSILFQVGNKEQEFEITDMTLFPTPGIAPLDVDGLRYSMVDLQISGNTKSGKPLNNLDNPFRFVIKTNSTGQFLSCTEGLPSGIFTSCSISGLAKKGTQNLGGMPYDVYTLSSIQTAAGTIQVYCLSSPSGDKILYLCGPSGTCKIN